MPPIVRQIMLSSEPQFPGQGYPERAEMGGSQLSAFGRLVGGRGAAQLGKTAVLLYDNANESAQRGETDMIGIPNGEDVDACSMIVTLAAPMIIPADLDFVPETVQSNPSGSQTNAQIRTRPNGPRWTGPMLWPQLEAIVEWGTGGASSRAYVDFMNGVQINLSASWLRVRAAIKSTQRSGVIGKSGAYVLTSHVGPGFTSPGRAQNTVYVGEADAAGETEVFAVPPFAKHVRLVGLDSSAAPPITIGTVRFWQASDGVAGGSNVGNFFFSGNSNASVEIPNGGLYVSVLNGQGVNAEYALVFDLSI